MPGFDVFSSPQSIGNGADDFAVPRNIGQERRGIWLPYCKRSYSAGRRPGDRAQAVDVLEFSPRHGAVQVLTASCPRCPFFSEFLMAG
jgi:hypothetical protein